MDRLDVSGSSGVDLDTSWHASASEPSAFQRVLNEVDGASTAGRSGGQGLARVPPTAGFVESPMGALPALPAAAAGAGEAGGALGVLARSGLGAAGAILLVPTNTQTTTEAGGVDGHTELGARIARAPGDLSGSATIFARGGDGRPAQDLTTLRMDPRGRLTAPGGDGAELGRRRGDGTVQLAPGVADTLDQRAGLPVRADAGGAGSKLPPGGAGSVRADGECDEDGSAGDVSPRSRLPTNGTWTGEPGNSGWLSGSSAVQAITEGAPVQFSDGRPDFTPWSKLSVNFRPGELTGDSIADRKLTTQALDASSNPDVQAAGSGERYLRQNGLTPHHATDTCMQLVPRALNREIAHIGGAADLRYQDGLGEKP